MRVVSDAPPPYPGANSGSNTHESTESYPAGNSKGGQTRNSVPNGSPRRTAVLTSVQHLGPNERTTLPQADKSRRHHAAITFATIILLSLWIIYANTPQVDGEAELQWVDLQGAPHCHKYGMREYTARISGKNILFYDRTKACQETDLVMHNVSMGPPNFCEDLQWRGVYGHWFKSFGEYQCMPHWDQFKDQGCIPKESGWRRFTARLMGIPKGEDWMTMCQTAPADILHLHFEAPTYCDDQGIWGMWGIWQFQDESCG